jgi:hypothetical protein
VNGVEAEIRNWNLSDTNKCQLAKETFSEHEKVGLTELAGFGDGAATLYVNNSIFDTVFAPAI